MSIAKENKNFVQNQAGQGICWNSVAIQQGMTTYSRCFWGDEVTSFHEVHETRESVGKASIRAALGLRPAQLPLHLRDELQEGEASAPAYSREISAVTWLRSSLTGSKALV